MYRIAVPRRVWRIDARHRMSLEIHQRPVFQSDASEAVEVARIAAAVKFRAMFCRSCINAGAGTMAGVFFVAAVVLTGQRRVFECVVMSGRLHVVSVC
jgi:hypothetical protein